jgi:AcrR family transcriptional regulator
MTKLVSEKYCLLLDAAKEIIAVKGLEKTTISDIVKKAGVAQGTFYLYFSSKNAVVPAIAEEYLENLFARIKEQAKGTPAFFDLLRVLIGETFKATKQSQDVLELCYSGFAITRAFEQWEIIYQPYYAWLEQQLNKAKEAGEVRLLLNTGQTVRMIINLIEGAAERLYLFQEKDISVQAMKDELFIFIKNAIYGDDIYP